MSIYFNEIDGKKYGIVEMGDWFLNIKIKIKCILNY